MERFGYSHHEYGHEFTFPGYRNKGRIFLLIVSLVATLFVGYMGLGSILRADIVFKGGHLFLFLWLAIWLLFIVITFRFLLWNIFNEEIITIANETMVIDRQGTLLKDVQTFEISEIKNLRIREETGAKNELKRSLSFEMLLPDPGNTIRFDHRDRTIKFGSGIDEAEAVKCLEKMLELKLFREQNLYRSGKNVTDFEL